MAGSRKAADKDQTAAAANEPERRDVYVANFEGDEINGKRYSVGDEIADDVDGGTIAYLVGIGRITHTTTADSKQPAVGGEPDALTPQSTDPLDGAHLTEEETAARDKLVEDEGANLDKLREIAANEGVEGVTADQDAAGVATLIIIKRRAA